MMPPVSGWFTVRVLQALCAALALLVSPGLQLAHAHTVSDPRAPSVRASAGGGRVVDEGSRPTPPARTARPLAALAGQGGGRRRAAARQRGEQRPGEASKHPLWLYHCEHEALVWFELDTLGNVRRLRGAQRFFAGAISSPPPDPLPEPPAPLPTDLGGYKYTAFGRLLPPDAGTPTPTALGQALSQPIRWQGRWFEEETGLYDFRNRVWSPELGAFLSPDEFGFFGTSGTLWSWPNQNPMTFEDPSGRDGGVGVIVWILGGEALGGGAVAGAAVVAPFAAIAAGGLAGMAAIDAYFESQSAAQRSAAIDLAQSGTVLVATAKTADEIIAVEKKGSIRREFPGEHLGKTLKEIEELARQGNRSAKKAKKLLRDRRFNKCP